LSRPLWTSVCRKLTRTPKKTCCGRVTGHDPYDDSVDVTAPENLAATRGVYHDRAMNAEYEITSRFQNGQITLYRVITAPATWTVESQHPGLYWAWDEKAAHPHWGGNNHTVNTGLTPATDVCWMITASVTADQIDWVPTLALNATFCFEDEREVRLLPSSQPRILSTKRLG
jgi:hypothetical protein